MAADDLATQGARASASMVLIMICAHQVHSVYMIYSIWHFWTRGCEPINNKIYIFLVNTMAADDLAMQGARASGVIVLTMMYEFAHALYDLSGLTPFNTINNLVGSRRLSGPYKTVQFRRSDGSTYQEPVNR